MTTGSQTEAAIRARRRTSEAMLERLQRALNEMRRERARITVAAAARRAQVSRTFLYQNEQARQLIAEAAADLNQTHDHDQAHHAAQVQESWKERALNAEDALKQAYQEIAAQRGQIGQLLGRIRDLEHNLPEDAVQRLLTENTTLKQKVRQLTTETKTLNERLKAARDNARFADRRLSELEAELLESEGIAGLSNPTHQSTAASNGNSGT